MATTISSHTNRTASSPTTSPSITRNSSGAYDSDTNNPANNNGKSPTTSSGAAVVSMMDLALKDAVTLLGVGIANSAVIAVGSGDVGSGGGSSSGRGRGGRVNGPADGAFGIVAAAGSDTMAHTTTTTNETTTTTTHGTATTICTDQPTRPPMGGPSSNHTMAGVDEEDIAVSEELAEHVPTYRIPPPTAGGTFRPRAPTEGSPQRPGKSPLADRSPPATNAGTPIAVATNTTPSPATGAGVVSSPSVPMAGAASGIVVASPFAFKALPGNGKGDVSLFGDSDDDDDMGFGQNLSPLPMPSGIPAGRTPLAGGGGGGGGGGINQTNVFANNSTPALSQTPLTSTPLLAGGNVFAAPNSNNASINNAPINNSDYSINNTTLPIASVGSPLIADRGSGGAFCDSPSATRNNSTASSTHGMLSNINPFYGVNAAGGGGAAGGKLPFPSVSTDDSMDSNGVSPPSATNTNPPSSSTSNSAFSHASSVQTIPHSPHVAGGGIGVGGVSSVHPAPRRASVGGPVGSGVADPLAGGGAVHNSRAGAQNTTATSHQPLLGAGMTYNPHVSTAGTGPFGSPRSPGTNAAAGVGGRPTVHGFPPHMYNSAFMRGGPFKFPRPVHDADGEENHDVLELVELDRSNREDGSEREAGGGLGGATSTSAGGHSSSNQRRRSSLGANQQSSGHAFSPVSPTTGTVNTHSSGGGTTTAVSPSRPHQLSFVSADTFLTRGGATTSGGARLLSADSNVSAEAAVLEGLHGVERVDSPTDSLTDATAMQDGSGDTQVGRKGGGGGGGGGRAGRIGTRNHSTAADDGMHDEIETTVLGNSNRAPTAHNPLKGRPPSGNNNRVSSANKRNGSTTKGKSGWTWRIIRPIGSGGFGTVYLGFVLESGMNVVNKQIDLNRYPRDKQREVVRGILNEIRLMREMHHPNIVEYKRSNITNNFINIFMEYIPGGSLRSLLDMKDVGQFTPQITAKYVKFMLEGLTYLHDKKIIHRDIKAANVLLTLNGEVKLADFGSAQTLQQADGFAGTVNWMPPEVVQNKKELISEKVDIWSLGCTVMELLTGKFPFAEKADPTNPLAVFNYIRSATEPIPIPEQVADAQARDFIDCCLRVNPRMRPSAMELKNHPFLQFAYMDAAGYNDDNMSIAESIMSSAISLMRPDTRMSVAAPSMAPSSILGGAAHDPDAEVHVHAVRRQLRTFAGAPPGLPLAPMPQQRGDQVVASTSGSAFPLPSSTGGLVTYDPHNPSNNNYSSKGGYGGGASATPSIASSAFGAIGGPLTRNFGSIASANTMNKFLPFKSPATVIKASSHSKTGLSLTDQSHSHSNNSQSEGANTAPSEEALQSQQNGGGGGVPPATNPLSNHTTSSGSATSFGLGGGGGADGSVANHNATGGGGDVILFGSLNSAGGSGGSSISGGLFGSHGFAGAFGAAGAMNSSSGGYMGGGGAGLMPKATEAMGIPFRGPSPTMTTMTTMSRVSAINFHDPEADEILAALNMLHMTTTTVRGGNVVATPSKRTGGGVSGGGKFVTGIGGASAFVGAGGGSAIPMLITGVDDDAVDAFYNDDDDEDEDDDEAVRDILGGGPATNRSRAAAGVKHASTSPSNRVGLGGGVVGTGALFGGAPHLGISLTNDGNSTNPMLTASRTQVFHSNHRNSGGFGLHVSQMGPPSMFSTNGLVMGEEGNDASRGTQVVEVGDDAPSEIAVSSSDDDASNGDDGIGDDGSSVDSFEDHDRMMADMSVRLHHHRHNTTNVSNKSKANNGGHWRSAARGGVGMVNRNRAGGGDPSSSGRGGGRGGFFGCLFGSCCGAGASATTTSSSDETLVPSDSAGDESTIGASTSIAMHSTVTASSNATTARVLVNRGRDRSTAVSSGGGRRICGVLVTNRLLWQAGIVASIIIVAAGVIVVIALVV